MDFHKYFFEAGPLSHVKFWASSVQSFSRFLDSIKSRNNKQTSRQSKYTLFGVKHWMLNIYINNIIITFIREMRKN